MDVDVKTLLVDDEEDILFLMRITIELANHGLVVLGTASNGLQALELIDELDPDVIVLDQMMPGLSGLDTAARIREQRPHQRIIMCSAASDDSLRRSLEANGIDYLGKEQISARLPDAVRRAAGAKTLVADHADPLPE